MKRFRFEKQSESAQMIGAGNWPVCVCGFLLMRNMHSGELSKYVSYNMEARSQQEQAGLRMIIDLSDSSQVFQYRRRSYTTLEDVPVAATVHRMEGNARQGVELLNVRRQHQNECSVVHYLTFKGKKKKQNIWLIQTIHSLLTCSRRQLATRDRITDADLCSMWREGIEWAEDQSLPLFGWNLKQCSANSPGFWQGFS